MPDEDLLFEKLRALRKTIAEEIGKPAYIVFSDKSLHALASEKPTNLFLFGNTYGIGEHKKTQIGERFVDLICNHLGVNRSPEPISSIQNQAMDEDTETMSYINPEFIWIDKSCCIAKHTHHGQKKRRKTCYYIISKVRQLLNLLKYSKGMLCR